MLDGTVSKASDGLSSNSVAVMATQQGDAHRVWRQLAPRDALAAAAEAEPVDLVVRVAQHLLPDALLAGSPAKHAPAGNRTQRQHPDGVASCEWSAHERQADDVRRSSRSQQIPSHGPVPTCDPVVLRTARWQGNLVAQQVRTFGVPAARAPPLWRPCRCCARAAGAAPASAGA